MPSDSAVPLRPLLLAVCVLFAFCACDEPRPPREPMTRETFVEIMVVLRRAAAESESQAAFEARKAEILREAGVTDSALLAYTRVHAGELDYMASVWDTIDARLNTFQPEPAR